MRQTTRKLLAALLAAKKKSLSIKETDNYNLYLSHGLLSIATHLHVILEQISKKSKDPGIVKEAEDALDKVGEIINNLF